MKQEKNDPINQSFTVHTYQLAALTPKAPRTLWMSLWGEPEAPGMKANYAEIEFVEDGTTMDTPRFTPDLKPGVSRIGIWFPISQFSRIAEILRNGNGVRCFYAEEPGKPPHAGIKDWNTKGCSTPAPYSGGEYAIPMAEVTVTVDVKSDESTAGDKAWFQLHSPGVFSKDFPLTYANGKWFGKTCISKTVRKLMVYGSNFEQRVEWTNDLADKVDFLFKVKCPH
jgi:hypothetical protein